MKNYYEILEVDRKASKEIIEKAYKTLAKKYHPDVQEQNQKVKAEEKMKLINEAYSVLSNEEQRYEYDQQLEENTISAEKYQELVNENIELKRKIQNNTTNKIQNQNQPNINYSQVYNNSQTYNQQEYNTKINQAVNQAYHDAYIRDMKDRGYKIKYKKDFNYYVRNFVALVLTITIFLVIVQIPFIKRFFINMYEENILIRTFADEFKQIFQ